MKTVVAETFRGVFPARMGTARQTLATPAGPDPSEALANGRGAAMVPENQPDGDA